MNRKDKRKDKKNKQLYKEVRNENSEFDSMFKILFGVLLVFFTVYVGYAIYNGDFAKTKKEEKPVEFQDIFILAGSTFNMDKDEYYVMYYDLSDEYSTAMGLLYEGYVNSGSGIKMYLVDLENKFNHPYMLKEGEKLNSKPKDISEFKVENPTLVKIKNKNIVEFMVGREKISKYLFDFIEKNKSEK